MRASVRQRQADKASVISSGLDGNEQDRDGNDDDARRRTSGPLKTTTTKTTTGPVNASLFRSCAMSSDSQFEHWTRLRAEYFHSGRPRARQHPVRPRRPGPHSDAAHWKSRLLPDLCRRTPPSNHWRNDLYCLGDMSGPARRKGRIGGGGGGRGRDCVSGRFLLHTSGVRPRRPTGCHQCGRR